MGDWLRAEGASQGLGSSFVLIPEIRSRKMSQGRDPQAGDRNREPQGWDTQAAASKKTAKLPLGTSRRG